MRLPGFNTGLNELVAIIIQVNDQISLALQDFVINKVRRVYQVALVLLEFVVYL